MIAELVATMALEGGYQELARIVHPHPTISEAVLDAARAVDGWAIHAWLSRRTRADLLLRPRLALRVPRRRADQRAVHRGGAGAAGVAADPARRAVPALRPRLLVERRRAGTRGSAEVERRAAAYGLPPIGWPEPWPGNTLIAMRAATFAKQTGRTVSFSLAAFRQAFAAGRDLTDPDNVMIAAAACELHPRALLKAVETDVVKNALQRGDRRGRRPRRQGVPGAGRRRRGLLGGRPAGGGGRSAPPNRRRPSRGQARAPR